MKALLITKCGCSKLIDISEKVPYIKIPLFKNTPINYDGPINALLHEVREFKYCGETLRMVYPINISISTYNEV